MVSSNKLTKFNKSIKIIVTILFSFYILSVFAFDEMPKVHYCTYVSISLLSVSVILYCAFNKKIFLDYRIFYFLLFGIYAFFITIINNQDIKQSFSRIIIFVTLFISYQALNIISNKKIIFYSILIPGIIYLTLFLIVYWQSIINLTFKDDRLGFFFGNVNSVGMSFLMFFTLSLFVGVLYKKYWLFLFSILFAFIAFTTGSKKVYLGIIFALFFIIFVRFRKKIWLVFAIFSLICVFGISLLQLPVFSQMKNRMYDMIVYIFTGEGDVSSSNRSLFAKCAIYLGFRNMFFGFGQGSFANKTIFVAYSHNNFSEMFCNFGLVGIFLFYSIFIVCLKNYKKIYSDPAYTFPLFMVIFYLLIGVGMIFYEEKGWIIYYAIALFLMKPQIIKSRRIINI